MESPFKEKMAINKYYEYSKKKRENSNDSLLDDFESENEELKISLESIYFEY